MKALALAPVVALAALVLASPVEAAHRHGPGCGHSYYGRSYSGYGGTRYYDDYHGGRYYGRDSRYARDYEERYYPRYGRGYGGYYTPRYRSRGYYGRYYAPYPAYGYGYYPPPPRYCPPRPRPRVGIYFGF